MAKLVKLEQKTFEGKPSGFKITLDDNRTGNLQEKESDKGLREGDEVFVTEIPYTSKAGKTSTLYGLRLNKNPTQSQLASAPHQSTIPPPSNRPSVAPSSFSELDLFNQKCLMSRDAMKIVTEAYKLDVLDFDKIKAKFKEVESCLWDSVNEITQ